MNYLFPLLAVVIWSGNTVVNKLAVGQIAPAEIGFFRWLLAGALLTPFLLRATLAHWPVIRANLGRIVTSACSAWRCTNAWRTTPPR